MYHIECFRCSVCSRQLLPGDEFSLREHELLCRADHGLLLERAAAGSPRSPGPLPGARGLHLPGKPRAPGRRPLRGCECVLPECLCSDGKLSLVSGSVCQDCLFLCECGSVARNTAECVCVCVCGAGGGSGCQIVCGST